MEESLVVTSKRRRKYSSYKEEIAPAVPNLVNRDFHSYKPGKLLLTDITEFSLPADKVYLSPVVDCFDGYLPTWTISLRPNANLVNAMLDWPDAGKRLDKINVKERLLTRQLGM